MTVAPVPGNGLPVFQARRTALVVIKLQLNCYDKGRREPTEWPGERDFYPRYFCSLLRMHNMRPVAAALPKSGNEVPPPHKPLKVEDDELTNRKKLLCVAAKSARPCPLWSEADIATAGMSALCQKQTWH